MSDRSPLIGRQDALAALATSLDAAREGRGAIWFVTGEPGMGKSCLADALAEQAAGDGFTCLRGHCWEAGGAPAFWPWVEVLRDLLRHDAGARALIRLEATAPHHLAALGQLLPELPNHPARASQQGAADVLDPEQARFRLLDAAHTLLREAALTQPLLVTLEDLHAADASSALLLELVARSGARCPLVVVATYRPSDARLSPAGAILERTTRFARALALAPLPPEASRRLAEATLGEACARSPDALEVLLELAEGHPLFLTELARLVASGVPPDALRRGRTLPLPERVRAAIRDRLALLAPATRELLEAAAVLGQELHIGELAQALGRPMTDLLDGLAEGVAAHVLREPAPGRYRFTHILLREALHAEIPPSRRARLHLEAAQAIEAAYTDAEGRPWSALAHHYLEAGPLAPTRAVTCCREAGEAALAQLAYDEATSWFDRALRAAAGHAGDDGARAALMLRLARARIHSGAVEAGRAACLEAAALARNLGDPELLARAALEYGGIFIYGRVDPVLVALLAEALDRLGPQPSPLRVRTLARYASALQPAPDAAVPIALAREAVAMARGLDDPETLLAAIRGGVSAMMDIAEPAERAALNREQVALAQALRQRADVFQGSARLLMDCLEMGDAVEARRALETCAAVADAVKVPHFAWRVAGYRAALAAFEGRFAEADALRDQARGLAERAGDPNAAGALALLAGATARAAERHDALRACHPAMDAALRVMPGGEVIGRVMVLADRARMERGSGPRPAPTEADVAAAMNGDSSFAGLLADAVAEVEDTAVVERVYAFVTPLSARFASWGLFGLGNDGPLARVLGVLAARLGRADEAARWFAEARERATRAGARPALARVVVDEAWAALRLGTPERARALLAEARESARTLDMPGLVTVAERLEAGLGPAAGARVEGARGAVALVKLGDGWECRWRQRRVLLPDTKGTRLIAALAERPGREVHVLELEGGGAGGAVDGGDAGELLDEAALATYRARVTELREALEEAETWHDAGRAEQARDELEALQDELARAVGLGGRVRRAGGAAERARVNVQRRIKDAIRRATRLDPELGRHLERSIKTGAFCRYEP